MTSDRGTSGGAELELNNTPVTPKSPALNPNASVFLSVKSLTPGTGPTDTGQQWEANDSGIANTTSSVSDCSFVNGDTSLDKTDTGVFSPTSDSPFHQEYTTYTDNLNENNANISTMKLDNTVGGSVILDNAGNGYNVDAMVQPTNYSEVNVPMSGIQYSSENGSITDGDIADSSVPGGELRSVLKSQLESYFSRENLSNDSYLMSQMDADQYVPIATVANLDQIQRLTTDIQLIVELLRESTFVQVDEKGEKVRPNHNRCIVILREIPESTPVQDVQDLFKGANCPKFVSCEFAHNSNWYVTFDSDADAQRAYQYLREEVRTFLGNPIMARIKAKPLIRTYQPRNGYINKRFQQPQVTPQQIQPEVVTSSAPQPQFTPTLPFTLTPNVSQYLNGQQAIPFYPPPTSQLLQTWPSPTMLDPSMVLAMNGYQATNVKVNSQVSNNSRNMFNSVNRNNYTRNQKPGGGGQPMGRDRINSNDSTLPPRLQHQQQERQMNAANSNMHKTSQSISTHAPVYQGRRGDGLGSGHGSHGNHSHSIHHGNHSHSAPMSHHPHHHHQGQTQQQQHHQGHQQPQHQQHLDGNNNANSSSNGALLNNRHSQAPDLSRYASNKSYKGRRRREDDGARLNRSNSSQSSQREGSMVGQQRPASDKFDYEPTSFPPLPGSGKNASSGEVFGESKLSDVVKGTAKLVVKEVAPVTPKPVSSPVSAVSTATTTVTTSIQSVTSSKEVVETIVASTCSHQSVTTALTTSVTKVTPTVQPSSVSQSVRPSTRTVQQNVPDTRPSTVESTQQSTPQTDDNTASISANSVKLSYAQMVQKTRVAEVSANSGVDRSDESETDDTETSQPPNRALKEQGQHPTQSSSKPGARGSSKDFSRKDSRENESESRRDDRDFRKENDFRRDEPREQRNRRAKENRERRFNDRDSGRRGDRRERDGPPPLRERDAPRTAPAASK